MSSFFSAISGMFGAGNSSQSSAEGDITTTPPVGDEIARATVRLSQMNIDRSLTTKVANANAALTRAPQSYDTTLTIYNGDTIILSTLISSDLPTVFDQSQHAIIFTLNVNNAVTAFHIQFNDVNVENSFKTTWSVALWEHSQQDSFKKHVKETDWVYNAAHEHDVTSNARDVEPMDTDMMDFDPQESKRTNVLSDEDEADDEDDEPAPKTRGTPQPNRRQTLSGRPVIEQLAVGAATNRSFVGRGSNLGIFSHNERGEMEVVNSRTHIKSKNGESFTPTKMLLHDRDERLLLLNADRPNTVYEMDVERGKIVNEYGGGSEEFKIRSVNGISKYAERTGEQLVLGVNNNTVFTLDPRINTPNKVAQQKTYATNNKMNTLSSTGQGEVAVGSEKGEIRLYNDISKNAKSALPGLGDPIIGLDTTEDGLYVLATCKNYLLIIHTRPDNTKNNGFNQSITKNIVPPLKLTLDPIDIQRYNITNIHFTPAHFNTGNNIDESWIITSTGPYIITWNFRLIKLNYYQNKFKYTIKVCTENVVADQFRFGQEDNVVVALEDTVYTQKRRIKK